MTRVTAQTATYVVTERAYKTIDSLTKDRYDRGKSNDSTVDTKEKVEKEKSKVRERRKEDTRAYMYVLRVLRER